MSHFRPVSPAQKEFNTLDNLEELFAADDEARKIHRMMTIADKTLLPHSMMVNLANDSRIANRTFMVDWMMREYLTKNSCEIRDTSIRIMDTYLAMTYDESPAKLADHTFLAFVGAASMILSSKLHQSHNPITAACFAAFNTEELAFFERQVVVQAGSRMSPLCTPSSFLPYVLKHCQSLVCPKQLADLAIEVIGDFLGDPLSMLFAPSTIAVSAVLVSLSYLHVSADVLLSSLPQFLLTNAGQPFFQPADKHRYLDVKLCVEGMSAPSLTNQRSRINTPSPSAIWTADHL